MIREYFFNIVFQRWNYSTGTYTLVLIYTVNLISLSSLFFIIWKIITNSQKCNYPSQILSGVYLASSKKSVVASCLFYILTTSHCGLLPILGLLYEITGSYWLFGVNVCLVIYCIVWYSLLSFSTLSVVRCVAWCPRTRSMFLNINVVKKYSASIRM